MEANQVCNLAGGNLTSIHSSEEFEFIQRLLISSIGDSYFTTWIGGKKNGNTYEWIDGTPFDFDNWFPAEPNNSKGVENCLELLGLNEPWNNLFNDKNCDTKSSFICQSLEKVCK